MKKKILGGIALLLFAAIAAWNVSLNSQSNDLSALSLANAEALAEFEFNGQNWDSEYHWYNVLGGSWTPQLHECQYSSNTGGSINGIVDGIGGGGISWNGSTTSYDGQMVTCVGGNGNCVNGTGCLPI
jgi:hypothetical protein